MIVIELSFLAIVIVSIDTIFFPMIKLDDATNLRLILSPILVNDTLYFALCWKKVSSQLSIDACNNEFKQFHSVSIAPNKERRRLVHHPNILIAKLLNFDLSELSIHY